ncbi:mRNA splicing protein [Bacidia gigantensis]|uniref:mRNA splicing protein n=1 Tax=Bacidia gigantensis TaxID=2732470 RepID=UPI001D047727|nr:mRNA splicing protein [Bacidia gigantensis]KAG8534240.1 mRNA splicing protein [Bacidia gigantensis]
MSRKAVEPAKKEQNEYIPAFISKKPFYLESADSENDYLEHQRLQSSAPDQSKWYDRGKRPGPAATKFRKGACENCGAMTHKTKECLSRPRAKGAKWTGKDIQADESVQDVQLNWDAKRDRWNGYDAGEYRHVVEEFEVLESLKSKLKGEKRRDGVALMANNEDGDQQSEEEEAKYAEESDMGRQQSNATRNLRLREDTAKYLLNLDLDSAKYDPKTRSMVDMGAQADQAAALVAEDNFMRASGDAAEFERAQKYAWETQERGDKNKLHLQANPTSGEYLRKKDQEEKTVKREAQRKLLLDRYGGEQYLQPSQLRNMAVIENDRYAEYDETGMIKDAAKLETKSKYPEDIYPNNHASVWGSWWSEYQWGYACCHSTVKNSYCTGEEGKQALEMNCNARAEKSNGDFSLEQKDRDKLGHQPQVVAKQEEVLNALAKKRTLLEMKGGITEEEMEAYKRSKAIENDPMANLLGNDGLLRS